ncbi:hypothetical protein GMI70_06880 [Eggerthellaceae bacterium zg-893]|nr:hypothetical protein [Eggerthellaceae bacterium zg-893]
MGNIDPSWYYTPLKLDCADGYISDPLAASPEDANGRGIDLTLLQDFAAVDASGYSVYLEWQTAHGCGLEPFEAMPGKGRFRAAYPGAMLAPGLAWARIAVYMGNAQVVTSRRFSVKVERNVVDLCMAEKDSDFSAFAQAVVDLHEIDGEMRAQAQRYAEAEDAREARYVDAEADRERRYAEAEDAREARYVDAEADRERRYAEAEDARDMRREEAEGVRDGRYEAAEAERDRVFRSAEKARSGDFAKAQADMQAAFDERIGVWAGNANTVFGETADRLVSSVEAAFADAYEELKAMVRKNTATMAELHGQYLLDGSALVAPQTKAKVEGTALVIDDARVGFDGTALALPVIGG